MVLGDSFDHNPGDFSDSNETLV
eukprot:SAG22_NODE_1945_length_3279_cov_1.768239_6_plen_22_part_01